MECCIKELIEQYWKRKWEEEGIRPGLLPIPRVRKEKLSREDFERSNKKLDAVSYESQFRKRITKSALEGVEKLKKHLLKKGEKEWRREAGYYRKAIHKPLSILDTAITELEEQRRKEREDIDDPLFTRLCREMFLHIAGTHYDGKISQKRVVFRIATILKNNRLLAVSEQDLDDDYRCARGPGDTALGQRILRSFKSKEARHRLIESHRQNYPCSESPRLAAEQRLLSWDRKRQLST